MANNTFVFPEYTGTLPGSSKKTAPPASLFCKEGLQWNLIIRFLALALVAGALHAQTADQVLIVVNKQSRDSREIGEYYLKKRGVPLANLCTIDTAPSERIRHEVYERDIRTPSGSS